MAYHEDDEHVVDVPALLEEFKKSRVHNAKEIVANTKWNEEPLLSSLPTAQRVLRHAARGTCSGYKKKKKSCGCVWSC